MTAFHVVIILAALAGPLLCGLSPSCHDSMPAVVQLSTMAIAGAIGHAQGRSAPHRQQTTSALPREAEYDSQPGIRRGT